MLSFLAPSGRHSLRNLRTLSSSSQCLLRPPLRTQSSSAVHAESGGSSNDALPHPVKEEEPPSAQHSDVATSKILHVANPSLASSSSPTPLSQLYKQQENVEPTLRDLEQFRIRPSEQETFSPGYRALFTDTARAIDGAFNRRQLFGFAEELLQRRPSLKTPKKSLITMILSKGWGIQTPDQVDKIIRERTEVAERVFPVTPAELFVLLGQDGHLFKSLAARHHATLFVESVPKLAIRAHAPNPDLLALGKQMRALTQELVTEVIELPAPLKFSNAVLQAMSRRTDAFVKQDDEDASILRATAATPEHLVHAKRAALHAWMMASTKPTLVTHSTSPKNALESEATYDLYPHSSSSSPLPWYVGSNAGSGFRAQRVGEWLMGSKMGSVDALVNEGVFETSSVGDKVKDIANILRMRFGDDRKSLAGLKVVASTGHVVLSSTDGVDVPSLLPSFLNSGAKLSGPFPISQLHKLLEDGSYRMNYLPALPPPLSGVQVSDPKVFVRLVYEQSVSASASPADDSAASTDPTGTAARTMTCEIPIDLTRHVSWSATSWKTEEVDMSVIVRDVEELDIALPDRPLDLRLHVSPNEDVPASSTTPHIHPDLVSFATQINSNPRLLDNLHHITTTTNRPSNDDSLPLAPLRLELPTSTSTSSSDSERPFLLRSAQLVKQSKHTLPNPVSSPAEADAWPELRDMLLRAHYPTGRPDTLSSWGAEMANDSIRALSLSLDVVMEDAHDLESQDRSATCFIECPNMDDPEAWRRFLLGCDLLTTHMYPQIPAGNKNPALTAPAVD